MESDTEGPSERHEGLGGRVFEEAENWVPGGRGKEKDHVEDHPVERGPEVPSGFYEC
jgi:hypothetical protein